MPKNSVSNAKDFFKDEVWKDLLGYEGSYQVSNKGRVRSLDRYIDRLNRWGSITPMFKSGRLLYQQINNAGYYVCWLYDVGHARIKLVHRLVAETFVNNPNNYAEVNHQDGDKLCNYEHNLEWMTRLQNVRHGIVTGLTDPTICRMALRGTNLKTGAILEFESQISAEEVLCGRRTGIISWGLKKNKGVARGYRWEIVA